MSGLRERKKAKTRALIQKEALRLFLAQGYSATTVEQVAEAAEVAPSTVFRYFATKEDLVMLDNLPAFVEALVSLPKDVPPVEAVRQAMRMTTEAQTPEELAESVEREKLMFTVPELWAASLNNIKLTMRTVQQILADRAGRPVDDPEIRNITGATMGVMVAAWFSWVSDPSVDGPAEVDRALAHLASGLPLGQEPG